jgi:hypothetical protein
MGFVNRPNNSPQNVSPKNSRSQRQNCKKSTPFLNTHVVKMRELGEFGNKKIHSPFLPALGRKQDEWMEVLSTVLLQLLNRNGYGPRGDAVRDHLQSAGAGLNAGRHIETSGHGLSSGCNPSGKAVRPSIDHVLARSVGDSH